MRIDLQSLGYYITCVSLIEQYQLLLLSLLLLFCGSLGFHSAQLQEVAVGTAFPSLLQFTLLHLMALQYSLCEVRCQAASKLNQPLLHTCTVLYNDGQARLGLKPSKQSHKSSLISRPL